MDPPKLAYALRTKKSAQKAVDDLESDVRERINDRIQILADSPRTGDVVKLAGHDNAYRTRVGNYRIIFEIDDKAKVVTILVVDHRSSAYRR